MSRTELQTLPERAVELLGGEARRHDAAALSARPRRGRCRWARATRRSARNAVDQDVEQGVGTRPHHLVDRSHDSRGRRHSGQGALARGEGHSPRCHRSRGTARCSDLRLRRYGSLRHRRLSVRLTPQRVESQSRLSRRHFPPVALRSRSSSPTPGRCRRGGRRDRHGHRPRGVPFWPVRSGLRRDRRRQGGVRSGGRKRRRTSR